jgi:hypothetical protein
MKLTTVNAGKHAIQILRAGIQQSGHNVQQSHSGHPLTTGHSGVEARYLTV